MQSTYREGTPTYQVMALFADAALSFGLTKGATFADLADRVDQLGERHIGMPKAIYLKFAMTRQSAVAVGAWRTRTAASAADSEKITFFRSKRHPSRS